MNSKILTRSLRAALMDRNVCQVRALLATHGVTAFATVLSTCSPRVTADALSLLQPADRAAVLRHLSSPQRDRLRPLGIALKPQTASAPPPHMSVLLPAVSLPWGSRRLLDMAL